MSSTSGKVDGISYADEPPARGRHGRRQWRRLHSLSSGSGRVIANTASLPLIRGGGWFSLCP
ncbi:MAG: hypothetical protein EOO27_16835 [Comamonadaceae bacterium]|nr:MAG: hypothetical protein EOO27_16835 [Comamonadaceae bacterium]